MKELRFVINKKCNFDCYFCHQEFFTTQADFDLSLDDYLFIYNSLRQAKQVNQLVTLTGGEPTLKRDLITLLAKLHKQGALLTLVSNGSNKEKIIKSLPYIDELHISLHGYNKTDFFRVTGVRNWFQKVIETLLEISKYVGESQLFLNIVILEINSTKEKLLQLLSLLKMMKAPVQIQFLIEFIPKNCKDLLSYPAEALINNLKDLGGEIITASSSKTTVKIGPHRAHILSKCKGNIMSAYFINNHGYAFLDKTGVCQASCRLN
jgi:molybdenum cofactor biosynthesis enzyme MoaA